MSPYRIVLAAAAKRALEALPEKIASAAIEFIRGPLADNPHRVGKRLRPPLDPLYGARRGEYRVLYQIRDEIVEVEIVAIAHRRDVYLRR